MIISVDYGIQKTGIAISDNNEKIALKYKVINEKSLINLINQIYEIVKQNKVSTVVLGVPRSTISKRVQLIAKQLKNLGIRVILWDENFTSLMARNNLQGLKTKKHNINSESARIILQEYLDFIKSS